MRTGAVLLLAMLTAAPAVALGGMPHADCDYVRDPSLLPDPSQAEAAARLSGIPLELVRPEPLLLKLDEVPHPGLPGPSEDHHACTGKIRPGAPLVLEGTYLCTANFIFRDAAGALYLGTAGHCLADLNANCVPVLFTDIRIQGIGDIGDGYYSTGNCGVGTDFALIKIDPAHYGRVDPTMCHWGGPTSVAWLGTPGYSLGQNVLLHYGWGFVYGSTSASRPRMHEQPNVGQTPNSLIWVGPSSGGDSGSAVQTHYGGAIGILTHGIGVGAVPLGLGVGFGTRIDRAIQLAQAGTGDTYSVVLSETPTDLTGLSVPH